MHHRLACKMHNQIYDYWNNSQILFKINKEEDYFRFAEFQNQPFEVDQIDELIAYFVDEKWSYSFNASGVAHSLYQILQQKPLAFYERIRLHPQKEKVVAYLIKEVEVRQLKYLLIKVYPILG